MSHVEFERAIPATYPGPGAVGAGDRGTARGPAPPPTSAGSHRAVALASWVALALATAGFGIATLALDGGPYAYSDGAQYISEAENIRRGGAFATSLPYFDEHYRLGRFPVPQTIHPPGFALLIAGADTLGIDAKVAPFVLNLLFYNLCPLVIYAIAKASGHGRAACLALAAVWYGFAVTWFNTLSGWSETPYTFFTLVGLLAIVRGRSAEGWAWPLLAGLAAACAFAVRYLGIFFVASVLAVYALRFARSRDGRSWRDLVLASIPPLVVILVLFGRNYALAGDFRGGNRASFDRSVGSGVRSVYYSATVIFGFDQDGLIRARPAELLLVAWAVLGGVWVVHGVRRVVAGRMLGLVGRSCATAGPALIYGALTVVGLVAMRCRSPINLDDRMLNPLIPVGLLACFELGRPIWRVGTSGDRRLGGLVAGLGLAAFLAGQAIAFPAKQAMYEHPNTAARVLDAALGEPLGGGCLADYLKARLSDDRPALANWSQTLGSMLDRPVLGLAPDGYTQRTWGEREVRDLMDQFGARQVVIFPGLLERRGEDDFYSQICAGRVPEWLGPVLKTDAVYLLERIDRTGRLPRPAETEAPRIGRGPRPASGPQHGGAA